MTEPGLILVSCGSAKGSRDIPRRLYTGGLFRACARYADSTGRPWVILSALHGVLDPDGPPVDPYDTTLGASRASDDAWARDVAQRIGPGPHTSLMGKRYNDPLRRAGVTLEEPLAGLGFGYRLQWLIRNTHNQGTLI